MTIEIAGVMHRERQELETLINEEALLLAKHLRGENDTWIPRAPSFPFSTVLECELAAQKRARAFMDFSMVLNTK